MNNLCTSWCAFVFVWPMKGFLSKLSLKVRDKKRLTQRSGSVHHTIVYKIFYAKFAGQQTLKIKEVNTKMR